jgi:hypothetical protein
MENRMKRALLILAVLVGAPVTSVFSQTTVSYSASVTGAAGVDGAAFPAGSTLYFSYTLNPGAADVDNNPSEGFFPDAVLSLSISFPRLGMSATAGAAGLVQTFDNVVDVSGRWSDQVFFFSGPILSSSLLGGAPIDSVEIDFLSRSLIPPDEPLLLSSDAVPLSHLSAAINFMFLQTANGLTAVSFTAVAGPVVRVTANGQDDMVVLAPGDPLDVKIGFDAGAPGVVNPAEVYIGLIAPFPPYVFWRDSSGYFVNSATPTALFTGALPSFPLTTLVSLPNNSVLPAGSYYWFMIVDDDNNGVLNGRFSDFVQTIVSP